jgi:hypothetical protein
VRPVRVLVGLIVGVAVFLAILHSGSSSSKSAATTTDDRPGAPSVYARIEASTSCSKLQEMFDIADANNRHPRSDAERDWTYEYMQAADARMQAIGCY